MIFDKIRMIGMQHLTHCSVIALAAVLGFAPGPAFAEVSVKVKAGDHDDFSRIAVTAVGGRAEVTTDRCGGTISMPAKVDWPLQRLSNSYSRRLTGYQVSADGKTLSLSWPCESKVRVRREDKLVFIDVREGPAETPAPAPTPVTTPAPAVAPAPEPAKRTEPVVAEATAPKDEPPKRLRFDLFDLTFFPPANAAPMPAGAANPAEPPKPAVLAESQPVPAPTPVPPPAEAAKPKKAKAEPPVPAIKPPAKAEVAKTPALAPANPAPLAPPAPVVQTATAPVPAPAAATAPAPVIPPVVPAAVPPKTAPDSMEQAVRQGVDKALKDLAATPADASKPQGAPKPPEGPTLHAFELADWAGTDFLERKQALEQYISESQGERRVDALIALARFNLARNLREEGWAALDAAATSQPTPAQKDELRILGDAFGALDGSADPETSVFVKAPPSPLPDQQVWRVATLAPTRWKDAKDGLPIALKRLLNYPADLRGRLMTLYGDAAAESDPAGLNLIVMSMMSVESPSIGDGRLDYFKARIAELRDDTDTALEAYRRAATHNGLYGQRARIRSVELRLSSGKLADTAAVDELEALRFAWRGDDVEADSLAGLGKAYTRLGRIEPALDLFGLLGHRFGATRHGREAMVAGKGLLTAVMGLLEKQPRGSFDPLAIQVRHGATIAQIDDDGQEQRRLARLLARDGFTVAATKVLNAVADKAKGPDRLAIGLELARVLLDAARNDEALAVLDQTTRIEADPASAETRALLRAEAYIANGDPLSATQALHGLSGVKAARLRAQGMFRAGEWAAARAAYGDLVKAPDAAPDDVAFALIAAFRAGDTASVDQLAESRGDCLKGTRWADLPLALAASTESAAKPLSTASIQRQLAAADAVAHVAAQWRSAP